MAIEIVTESEETHSKGILEENAKKFLIDLIKDSLENNDIECWSISLAQNILATLENQVTKQ
ncbi:hypothetical protein KLEP7_gp86 [Pseudaeromonas phage vB_PpeM_ KLEP7]|nr:hypothetical protein KLEP7_gp86 [Pseudaeromonas phage vB_PpeM_ KLEP7]